MAPSLAEGVLRVEAVPPLFSVGTDDIDVAVFASVEEAEGDMEAIDVLGHEYDVFDALARKVQLEIQGDDVKIAGVSPVPDERSFRERVARFLTAIGHPVDPEQGFLSDFTQDAYRVISDWQHPRRR